MSNQQFERERQTPAPLITVQVPDGQPDQRSKHPQFSKAPRVPISFFVPGIPQTAGSKRGFALPKKGQPMVVNGKLNCQVVLTDDNAKGKDWKNRVADAGNIAMAAERLPFDSPLLVGPLAVSFTFRMPRLKAHYTRGALKPNAALRPVSRPDVLKLARCAEDALTGVVWYDDSQIVIERLEKVYDAKPGVTVTVLKLGADREIEQEHQATFALP